MKNLKKFAALIALVAVFAGCSLGGGGVAAKDPKVVLRDAVKSLYSITSGGYEVALAGKMVDTSEGGPGAIEFDLGLTGAASFKDATKPLLTAKLVGSGKMPAQSGDIEAELRLDAQNLYGILSKITLADEADTASLKDIIGKWYKTPVPAGSFDQLQLPMGKTDDQLTAEEKQMKDLLTTTDFFKDITVVGSESVLGEKATHYAAVLDVDAVGAFTAKSYELKGQAVDEAQIATMKENLTKMNAKFDIWVGDDGVFRKFAMTMVAGEADKAAGQYLDNFNLSVALKGINKEVTVEAPAGALDLDPNVMMQAGAALQGMGGGLTAPVQ